MSLKIENLHISVDTKAIVKGLNLEIPKGKVTAIMGPNGSGKSTLANTLAGHPKYAMTDGTIELDGENITHLSPDKRAKAGLFLSMQYAPEIPGVTLANFLRIASGVHLPSPIRGGTKGGVSPLEFHKLLMAKMAELKIDPEFARRYVNTGFSGGEKKRAEILQLLLLNPTYAVLDETDSGLDVDALKIVAEGINKFKSPEHGILLITHYNRILEYVVPDMVHIMMDGKIVKSGGKELAKEIETSGYSVIQSEVKA